MSLFFFLFNYTAPPEIYTLSLHDALPISRLLLGRAFLERTDLHHHRLGPEDLVRGRVGEAHHVHVGEDRKSTRLNSSHTVISYAVFCLKKKKKNNRESNRVRVHM